jgi:hypothetical protein
MISSKTIRSSRANGERGIGRETEKKTTGKKEGEETEKQESVHE